MRVHKKPAPLKPQRQVEGTHPHTSADHWNSTPDAITRDEASREIAQIGGHKWYPCEQGDSLQAESSRVTQVLGQPEDVEPPDRIGQPAAEHDTPNVPALYQLKPSCNAPHPEFECRLLAGANQGHFLRTDRGMTIEWMVDTQPHRQPNQPQGS